MLSRCGAAYGTIAGGGKPRAIDQDSRLCPLQVRVRPGRQPGAQPRIAHMACQRRNGELSGPATGGPKRRSRGAWSAGEQRAGAHRGACCQLPALPGHMACRRTASTASSIRVASHGVTRITQPETTRDEPCQRHSRQRRPLPASVARWGGLLPPPPPPPPFRLAGGRPRLLCNQPEAAVCRFARQQASSPAAMAVAQHRSLHCAVSCAMLGTAVEPCNLPDWAGEREVGGGLCIALCVATARVDGPLGRTGMDPGAIRALLFRWPQDYW